MTGTSTGDTGDTGDKTGITPSAKPAPAIDTSSSSDTSSSDTSASNDKAETGQCEDSGVTLTFDVGSKHINGRGRSSLNGVAKWLKADDDRSVEVNGYTDSSGGTALNEALSQERADAVKTYLVTQGIPATRVEANGHGESEDRPADLENTRAVAVTVCDASEDAAAPSAPEPAAEDATPPPPAPVPVQPLPPSRTYSVHTVTTTASAPPPRRDLPPSVIGVGLTLGGGATGFWQSGARSFADTGGEWDVRLTFGTRLPVAFEAAYVGTAQGITALGLESDAVLLGNGVEGDARINLSRSRIQPYIFGGAGWMNYQIRNTSIATSSLQRSNDAVFIPFGVGVQARLGRGFLLDVRGTGRATFDDGLLKQVAATTGAGDARLHNWNAAAHLGWEF